MFAIRLFFPISRAFPAGTGYEAGSSTASFLRERFGTVSSHLKLYGSENITGGWSLEGGRDRWVRCDLTRKDLEPFRGTWNFGGTDALATGTVAQGLRIRYWSSWGASAPRANGGKSWNYPTTDLQAWRDYMRTFSLRYQGSVCAWEVWSEENITQLWMPEPDVDRCIELLAAASEEIRAADPGAVVVVGGMTGLGYYYLGRPAPGLRRSRLRGCLGLPSL